MTGALIPCASIDEIEANRTSALALYGEAFDKLMEAAGILDPDDLRVGHAIKTLTVLEPSAGRGALAERAAKAGHLVTCIEIQREHAQALQLGGRYVRVIHADFLAVRPEPTFDVVIMNPPFDTGRDIDHVTHALGFVRPGGKLVSVMSAGVEFREDRKTADFRRTVERFGGRFIDLPAGSFEASGTMVNTVLVTLRVPLARQEAA